MRAVDEFALRLAECEAIAGLFRAVGFQDPEDVASAILRARRDTWADALSILAEIDAEEDAPPAIGAFAAPERSLTHGVRPPASPDLPRPEEDLPPPLPSHVAPSVPAAASGQETSRSGEGGDALVKPARDAEAPQGEDPPVPDSRGSNAPPPAASPAASATPASPPPGGP